MTMTVYVQAFNRLAEQQMTRSGFPERVLWRVASPEADARADEAQAEVRRRFTAAGITPVAMAADVFAAVRTASGILLERGIPHSVTVGEVRVDGRGLSGATADSLAADLAQGHVPGREPRAHAWLTLADGTVLDLALLPLLARREGRKPLKMINALYRSDIPVGVRRIAHEPLLLGPEYHVRVSEERSDAVKAGLYQWILRTDALLRGE